MYLIDRFSLLLRCDVALHFINTWGINDLTFDYYWKQLQRWLLLLEQVITLVVEKNYNLNEQKLRGLLEN